MARSTAYTGSMTWGAGEQAQARWVYTTQAGQASKTLTVAASGPNFPTRDNIIKTDVADFDFVAVQIRLVKTVHTDAMTFTAGGGETGGVKAIWAWAGPDDFAFGPLRYNGDGNGPCIIHCGQSTQPWANSRWAANVGHFMQNGETANAENVTSFPLSPSPYTLLSGPFKLYGIHLQFQPINEQSALTGNNTWSIEIAFNYY